MKIGLYGGDSKFKEYNHMTVQTNSFESVTLSMN